MRLYMTQFSLIALLAICSVAQASDIDEQVMCSHEGRKFAKEWKSENEPNVNSLFRDTIVGNPEFHFSKSLKTCLVYTDVTEGELEKDSPGIWHQKRITDIYSNRVLVYTRYMTDKETKKEVYVPLKVVGDAKLVNDSDFVEVKTKYFSE